MARAKRLGLFAVIALIGLGVTQVSAQDDDLQDKNSTERSGKVFSLFNVVQFKNTGCQSQSSVSSSTGSGYRNGTCFTSTECASKGGTASGNCAAGFGVCCVFFVTSSGGTITQNCTYIQNPGFPSSYAGTSSVSYTVNKNCPGVCYLRLDFDTFTTRGTSGTTQDTGGGTCLDTFKVTTTPSTPVPTICGQNSGQHMYLDLGTANSGSATLAFTFSGTSTTRMWEIKVTQVLCSSKAAPPNGCLQYETGLTGRLETFNFDATGQSYLASQKYSICIRQEAGYCCVEYMPCSDPNSFVFNQGAAAIQSGTDTYCGTVDYVGISGSSGICATQAGNNGQLTNRYCGIIFNAQPKNTLSSVVCDCTSPFSVDIFTDNTNTKASTTKPNRGVCLTYTQIPCATG